MTLRWAWVVVLAVACSKDPPSTTPPEAGGAAAQGDSDADLDDPAAAEEADEADESDESDEAGPELDESVQEAMVKVKVVRGKTKIAHPGYLVTRDEEVTIVMKKGGRAHEVDFLFEQADDGYTMKVVYRDNGRKILTKSVPIKMGEWMELGGGGAKVQVLVDPDAKRKDELELGEGKQPLDAVE